MTITKPEPIIILACFYLFIHGSFPAQNPCPVPSGAGVPARHCTVARPMVRYSTFQPQVPYIPLVPGSIAAYLRIVAPLAMSRDKAYILISHIYEPPPEGAWVHYENGTLRDRGPDLYVPSS